MQDNRESSSHPAMEAMTSVRHVVNEGVDVATMLLVMLLHLNVGGSNASDGQTPGTKAGTSTSLHPEISGKVAS